jgi:hypothetical protein
MSEMRVRKREIQWEGVLDQVPEFLLKFSLSMDRWDIIDGHPGKALQRDIVRGWGEGRGWL